MLTPETLKKFFDLVKAKQQPYEDALTANMQGKVDAIKRQSTYNLTDNQKKALERDKALLAATEGYVSIQHEIISHLFQMLEEAYTQLEIPAAILAEAMKVAKEEQNDQQTNQIQNEGEVHTAA